MIIIKEIKQGNKSIYEKSYKTSSNKILKDNIIEFPIHKATQNNYDWFILYDDNYKPITSVFRFINYDSSSQSYNSREKSIYAIRLLYIFMKLFNVNINEFTKKNVEKLQYFLSGYSPLTGDLQLDFITKRSNETLNGYLSIYRNYLSYLSLKDSYLFDTKVINSMNFNPITNKEVPISKYKSNKKTGHPFDNIVPKYINKEDFALLISLTRKNDDLLSECLIRLMYEYGLRLGEVLGLTFQDVKEIKIGNSLTPVLILRNRISDNKDQKAKTCINSISYDQYNSVEYKTKNLGYQEVLISYDTYELLNEYIEIYHFKARQNDMNKYVTNVSADIIKEKNVDENYYIFLNTWGNRLSSNVWNKQLKKMYKEIGIVIDTDKKKNNLSHRLRHGYAMYHVLELNTKILELQRLMRHASITSTMVYYNPTEEDKINKLNTFVGEAFKDIT